MRNSRRITLAITICFLVGFPAVAQMIMEISPGAGEVGETIQLTGAGFDPGESYTVHLEGNVTATATAVLADSLTFDVPAGARSGRIQIETVSSGAMLTVGSPLTVVRPISVQIDPALAAVTTGYDFGTLFGESGSSVLVPVGEPGIVVGFSPADDDPLLLGVATENTTSLTLNAESTAAALAFVIPHVRSTDPVEAESRIATLGTLPETIAVSAAIDAHLAAGTDYYEDRAFKPLYVAAVEAFVQTLPESGGSSESASAGGAGSRGSSDTFEDDLVQQDLSFEFASPLDLAYPSGPPKHVDIESVPGVVLVDGKPHRKIRFQARDYLGSLFSPLDWIVAVYEIDPFEIDSGTNQPVFPSGGADLATLTQTNDVYRRLYTGEHLGFAVLPQESIADELNVFAAIADKMYGDIAIAPDPSLLIPSDRPGLFVVRAVSGAYWPDQDPLIDAMPDGNLLWGSALALNATLYFIDYASVAIPAGDVMSKESISNITNAALLAATNHLGDSLADGDVSGAEAWGIVRDVGTAVASSFSTSALKEAAGEGFKEGVAKGFGRYLLYGVTIVDATGTYSNVVQRRSALLNSDAPPSWFPLWGSDPNAAAVETAIVAIGDPWSPLITAVEPHKAHRNQVIRLHGRNFSAGPTNNVVGFVGPSGVIDVQPVVANQTTLHVKVPDQALVGDYPITVATQFGSASTADSSRTFTVHPAPSISSVVPMQPLADKPFTLSGVGFVEETLRVRVKVLASLPTYDTYDLNVAIATTEDLLVSGFNEDGLHDIQVEILDEDLNMIQQSPVFNLNVTLGAGQSVPAGTTIRVNTLADNLISDNWITLREAMLWATEGQFFRVPSAGERALMNDDLPLLPTVLEDTIAFIGLAPTDVIVLDPALGPLPGMGSFDTMIADVSLTIDGSNLTGDGLTLNIVQGIEVKRLTFRNFGGHCVFLRTATENFFDDVIVEDCGGDGFRVEDGSSENRFLDVGATFAASDGIHINGAGSQYNSFEYSFNFFGRSAREIADNIGFGLRVDGGAKNNLLFPGDIRRNFAGGIWVSGINTTDNVLGYPYRDGSGQAFMEITDNLGGGVRTNAARTSMNYLRVGNNIGDGILLEGSSHTGSTISSCSVGLDPFGGSNGNTKSGIHLRGQVSDVRIGSEFLTGYNVGPPNEIGANGEHGIWLEGPEVHNVTIDNSRIGAASTYLWGVPPAAGNAIHGIALTHGAHDNTLGQANEGVHLEIVAHTSGAGIYMDGAATTGNKVIGNHIGGVKRNDPVWGQSENLDASLGNQYGIWITNQAWGNTIGTRGWSTQRIIGTEIVSFDPANYFHSSTEAGILIESGGDPSQTIVPGSGQTVRGANVVQNNEFGRGNTTYGINKYGLILRGSAYANRIGGAHWAEANSFNNAWKASVWIDGVAPIDPVLSNRIVNNDFWYAKGYGFTTADPLDDPTDGIGILVSNSQNQIIGGESPADQNVFARNRVGIHVDHSDSIVVQHNAVGISTSFTNEVAGVILSDSTGCTVGPGNLVRGNGKPDPGHAHGGLSILRGGQHTIVGNYIGLTARTLISAANEPWGVLLRETADNQVGMPGHASRNVIVATNGVGLRLEGAGSSGNHVANNWIGIRPQDYGIAANAGAGVELQTGANGNTIGGTMPVMVDATQTKLAVGNRIHGNTGGGIVADGGSTTGNSYLHNSISGHPTTAIQNLNGANAAIAPPTITMIDNQTVIGTTAGVPAGSIVQVFADGDDEGETWVGEALTEVDGSFEAPLMAPGETELRATLTDGVTGSTSELGNVFSRPAGVDVQLDPAVTIPATADSGATNVVLLPLEINAQEISASVVSILIEASGTLHDPSGIAGVSLYDDLNGDGAVDASDPLLGGPAVFAADDGSTSLTLDSGVVSPSDSKRWLVAVDLTPGATVGTTFAVSIALPTSVSAQTVYAGNPLTVAGTFPIASPLIDVTAGGHLGGSSFLTVSSDPADAPNFIDLQTAIDTVGAPGARVDVLPGLTGAYLDNLVIQAAAPFVLSGGGAVTLDGTGGTAVTVLSGSSRVTIDGMTLSGDTGLHAQASTRLRNVTFSTITTVGANLQSSDHEIVDSVFEAGNYSGLEVGAAGAAVFERSRMHDLGGTGIRAFGDVVCRSSLIEGGSTGFLIESGGSATMSGCTIAGHALAGVEALSGSMISIDTSILWGNSGFDLLGGLCAEMANSLSGSPDCSGMNGNLVGDPLFTDFGVDHTLSNGSPAIDAGPSPALFDGTPALDLDGGPRLIDFDGDGLAHIDLGAYEMDLVPPPSDLELVWTTGDNLTWSGVAAVDFHLYRGTASTLSYGNFGVCRDDLDADRTDTQLTDNEVPSAGVFHTYLVTDDDGSDEGTLGIGSSAERSNFGPCP